MSLLRILVPSWNFFEHTNIKVSLYYKLTSSNQWLPVLTKPKRKILHLFLNPHTNIYLSQQSLVERFAHELQINPSEQIDTSVTYLQVLQIVKFYLRQKRVKSASFQFKIEIKTPFESYDTITSAVHELKDDN